MDYSPIQKLRRLSEDTLSSSSKIKVDLSRISQWAYQWKIPFNTDVSKQD